MSQSWSPTLASVVAVLAAAIVAVWSFAPLSVNVIQAGQEPEPSFAKVTSTEPDSSSSVAVSVALNAAPCRTEPASASPAPSLDRYGASLTATSVIVNWSVAVAVPSDTVQVIEKSVFVVTADRSPEAPVPPSSAVPPVSEPPVSVSHVGSEPVPVLTQEWVRVSPSTSVEVARSTVNARSS